MKTWKNLFYEHLKTVPFFRYALVGIEVDLFREPIAN